MATPPPQKPTGLLLQLERLLRRHGCQVLADGVCFVGIVTSGIIEVVKNEHP